MQSTVISCNHLARTAAASILTRGESVRSSLMSDLKGWACASAIVRSLSGSGFVASTNANVPAYLSRAPLVPEEGRQHEGL